MKIPSLTSLNSIDRLAFGFAALLASIILVAVLV